MNRHQDQQFVNFTNTMEAAPLYANDGNYQEQTLPRLAPSESFEGEVDDNASMAVELSSVESGAVSNFRDFDLRDSTGSAKSFKRRLSRDMSISNTPRDTSSVALPNRLPLFIAPPSSLPIAIPASNNNLMTCSDEPSLEEAFPPVELSMNSEQQLDMMSPLSASISWRGSQPQLEAVSTIGLPSGPTSSMAETPTTFATLADAPAEWWKERASHHFNRALQLQQFPPRWTFTDGSNSGHSDSGSSRSTSIATSLRVEVDSFYDDDGGGSTSDAAATAAAVSAAQYQDRMFASSVDNLSLIDARSDTQALSDDDDMDDDEEDDSDLSSGDDEDNENSEGDNTAGRSRVSNISDRRTAAEHETMVSGHKHGRSRSRASSVMSTSPSMDSHLSDMQSYDSSRHLYSKYGGGGGGGGGSLPPRLAPPSTSPSIASGGFKGDESGEPKKKLRRKLTSTPSDDASSTAAVVMNPVMVDVSPLSTSPSLSMRAPLHGHPRQQEYRAVSLAELPSMLGKHSRSQGSNSEEYGGVVQRGGGPLVASDLLDRPVESETLWMAKRQRLPPSNTLAATDYSTAIQQSLARRQATEDALDSGDSSLIRRRRSRLFQRRRLWKQHQASQQHQQQSHR